MLKYIIIIVILILIFIGLLVYSKYQKIKDLEENINICKNKIRELLNKKRDYLKTLAEDAKEKDLKILLKEENIDMFQEEDLLFEARWKLDDLINDQKYTPKQENETYYLRIKEIEEDLDGLKDYFNSKVITYNEMFENKLFKPIYKLFKLEHQKQFKLRKIESYEILKD